MTIIKCNRTRVRARTATRAVALAVPLFLASALLAAGCGGGTKDEAGRPAGAVVERVDSTQRFSGQKRAVARVIERFEAATRRRDRGALCRKILVAEGDRFSRRRRDPVADCRGNPELAPALDLRQAGGRRAYDLAVESVKIGPRRRRLDPDATARVRMPARAPFAVEHFDLARTGGEWRLRSRRTSAFRSWLSLRDLQCAGGTRPVSWSTDVFLGESHERIDRSGREAVLHFLRNLGRQTKRPSRLHRDGSAEYRKAVAAHLVRVGIFYGGGRADYEYRPPGEAALASFTLIRIGGRYYVLAYQRCLEALPR